MTQFQFDVICKLIEEGAPVLAKELCDALNNLVVNYNALVTENAKLKARFEEPTIEENKAEELENN
jgi:regulator of replication initiation timing